MASTQSSLEALYLAALDRWPATDSASQNAHVAGRIVRVGQPGEGALYRSYLCSKRLHAIACPLLYEQLEPHHGPFQTCKLLANIWL